MLRTLPKGLLALLAGLALAACRETNPGQQGHPSTGSDAGRTLRFDTAFVAPGAARTYHHRYAADVPVGRAAKTVLVPLEIEWTTSQASGCAQVTAVRVYQLGPADRRTRVSVRARRDAVCRPGPAAAGDNRPADAATYTGLAYLKLTCEARTVHAFTTVSLTLNGLGYHDELAATQP